MLQSTSGGNPLSPDVTNATFALAAGDSALVTLRVFHDGTFDPSAVAAQTISQAANSDGSVSAATSGPAIHAPSAGARAEATGPTGAVVSFTVTSEGATGSSLPVTCLPASGSLFPIGSTTVTCSATDPTSSKTSTVGFLVTVVDTTPPVVTVPGPITAQATSSAGAVVTYSGVTAVDAVDGTVAATCNPASGSVFPFGTTVVTCSATDSHGNTGTASFTVKVQDTTPPAVTAAAAPNTLLWSPNKAMTPVVISGTVRDASPVTAAFSVRDEYGTVQPSGTITVNANGSYSFTVLLQAWRAGTDSNGRLYVVTVTARDAGGYVGSASATVVVPHN